ncbi:MAG: SAM-dependent methyltransferase [Sphingomonas sp. 28-63-12]|nr:MAG: SAM-dependent methyltransferase [Sphingomonas sp. 28-63-12]
MSRAAGDGTSARVDSPDIFDRTVRRRRRDRAQPGFAKAEFLRQFMLEGIAGRLDSISRQFGDILDLGCFDAAFVPPVGSRIARLDSGFGFAAAAHGVQGDEDRLPFGDAVFDLVLAAGTLDSVGDLPGALTLARRVLRPDGLFLAAFVGAGSLGTLRSTLLEAEADRPAARIHPQVDVRAAGDLLMRAGFALPVADTETVTVRYASLLSLLRDLRGMGASNAMPGRSPLRRDVLDRAAALYNERADADGRTTERFEIVFMTGWAPAPSQPQPARRGSGTQSLADALRPPRPKSD